MKHIKLNSQEVRHGDKTLDVTLKNINDKIDNLPQGPQIITFKNVTHSTIEDMKGSDFEKLWGKCLFFVEDIDRHRTYMIIGYEPGVTFSLAAHSGDSTDTYIHYSMYAN